MEKSVTFWLPAYLSIIIAKMAKRKSSAPSLSISDWNRLNRRWSGICSKAATKLNNRLDAPITGPPLLFRNVSIRGGTIESIV